MLYCSKTIAVKKVSVKENIHCTTTYTVKIQLLWEPYNANNCLLTLSNILKENFALKIGLNEIPFNRAVVLYIYILYL